MDEELTVTLEDFKRALLRVKESISGSNVIESISLNGQEIAVSDSKAVDIVLPVASAEQTGVVKIGGGLDVTEDGTASVDLSTLSNEQVNVIAEKIMPTEEEVSQVIQETFAVDRTQQ